MNLYEFKKQYKSNVNHHKNNTFGIVSKVAYMLGVPEKMFLNEHEPIKHEVYAELKNDKSARIIRHLCILRTAIERNFQKINNAVRFENKSLFNMPEFIPQESIKQLSVDGVNILRSNDTKITQQIIEINSLVSDRINNCKLLFPTWLKWEYLKDLFIMKNGLKEEGVKAAAGIYYQNLSCYPYQMYMNWVPKNEGNIFYNDEKFVNLLYEWNGDYFRDRSKVTDASDYAKRELYNFVENGKKIIMLVDSENADPFNFSSALKNLDAEYLEKIEKIIVFYDINANSAWKNFGAYCDIPVIVNTVKRINPKKSRVDFKLLSAAKDEFNDNAVDSFIIISSDSDFWSLVEDLPNANIFFMLEHGKDGKDLRNALYEEDIPFFYMDEFCSANTEDMKKESVMVEIHKNISEKINFNLYEMFSETLKAKGIKMETAEKKQFFERYFKNIQASVSVQGNLILEFKN